MVTVTRQAVNLLLEPYDEYSFLFWAFGKHYPNMTTDKSFMHAWNGRHKMVFEIKPDNTIVEDIEYMIEIWRNCHGR